MTTKKRSGVPGYLLHKATRQARVILDGRTHYLGVHGSKKSKERYGRLLAQWDAPQLLLDRADSLRSIAK